MENIKIASVYGKDSTQNILYNNTDLYVDPNKKRTSNWLRVNRLQLPLHEDQSGSINKIAYVGNSVKVIGTNSLNAKLYKALGENDSETTRHAIEPENMGAVPGAAQTKRKGEITPALGFRFRLKGAIVYYSFFEG